MASTPQEKFDAAVKVIQSLPKEGPFQPSHEMMLMFYAYFKQATEGPCHRKKPYMWEVVAKAKWDAWNKLGDMDREVAMVNYVEELKKIIKINNEKWKEMEKNQDPRIVEAMPQTNDVGKFMETLGSFYEIVDEDSPIESQTALVPNHTGGGGSAGVTPDHSHSDTSSEHDICVLHLIAIDVDTDQTPQSDLDKEDDLNFSLRVEQTLQLGFHGDEADAIPEFPVTESVTTESGEIIQEELVVNGEEIEEVEEEEEMEEEEEDEDTEKIVSNSESEEEFCDTSEVNPSQEEEAQIQETIPKIPHIDVQSSTPLKREIKRNHVRFATTTDSVQNGRVSPIMDVDEYLHLPSGFPFIHNKLNGPLSDSLLVQTDGSCDVTTTSLVNQSCITGLESGTESDYSANNSVLNPETPGAINAGGGEENEPPGGGDSGDRRGQSQRSKEGEPSRASQNSGRGVPTQGGSQRSVLLTEGGGGGEDNPPQGPPTYQSSPVNDQIALILVRLQQDMNSVLERLNRLEDQNRQRQGSDRRRTSVLHSWWPFSSATGRTAFFVLIWPVIVHLVLSYLFSRRRSGKPLEQLYRLTHLKLSNIRSNDELVPEPHEIAIGPQMINKTFPADHPYSSHLSRAALFPKFDSSEDPKRGVSARYEQPISDEMPATAADSLVIHKTKGFGARHEIVAHPHASEKKGLEWVGEQGFNQLVKVHDGRQEFYPIPPKTVAPNLQARGPEMRLSQRSANALRNIERDQWQTTYDRSNTGLGPSNPNKLDNLAEKTQFYDTYGITDDKLYPRSINTLDPPRPQEGRIAKMLVPRPPPLKTADAANAPENPNYLRMQTLSEREEQRLLQGKDYINLPTLTPEEEEERWKELQNRAHQDPNLERVDVAKTQQGSPDDVPFHPAGAPSGAKEAQYLDSTKRDQDKNFQEIEAQNRWKVLEAHGPSHDITSLNYKMGHVHEEEKPSTFYGHEGKFNEERAGLYKTNYSPERLAYNMNALEVSGPEIMNTMHSHIDALNLPTKLNYDMKDAFRYSRTLSTSQPNLSGDRRETRELVNQLDNLKFSQKLQLQPTVENARVKVQEGGIILKDSEMGDNFNTRKFLQEYDIGKFSRYEPLKVMSTENQNLHNVRKSAGTKSGKSVKFSDTVSVATSLDSGKLRFSSAPTRGSPRVGGVFNSVPALSSQAVEEPEKGEVITTQYTSTQALYNPENELDKQLKPKLTVHSIQPKEFNNKGLQAQPQPSAGASEFHRLHLRRPATSDPDTEYRNEFGSKATNFIPSNLQNSLSFSTSYDAQFPVHDIGYKHDSRFEWQPGYGVPRPQTHLLKIQNRFEKSAIRRSFQNQFQESNPDLRQNIVKGKKHDFYGISGQLLHG